MRRSISPRTIGVVRPFPVEVNLRAHHNVMSDRPQGRYRVERLELMPSSW